MDFGLLSPAIEVVRRRAADYSADLDTLDLARDFVRWPVADASAGLWSIFPLVYALPAGFAFDPPIDVPANRARCPRAAAALATVPGLVRAGYSLIGPRTTIHRHIDLPEPGVRRFHLGLRVPDGCVLYTARGNTTWVEGGVLELVRYEQHGVHNASDDPRVVLLFDLAYPAAAGSCGIGRP